MGWWPGTVWQVLEKKRKKMKNHKTPLTPAPFPLQHHLSSCSRRLRWTL